jgi:3-oxoadipate enol-lactonase
VTVPVLVAGPPTGSGPLLVLGPSLGTSTVLWEDAAALLQDRFTTVSWDLPGHGRSPATDRSFTVEELAAAVVRIADELGVERFAYAGDSLGGAVGIALLTGLPERVSAAAIICSAARIGTADGWLDRAATARATGTASLVVQSAERWFAPGSIARRPEISGRLLNVLRDTDDESYALCCEALAAYDGREGLAGIRAPVDVIVGESDVAVPHEASRVVADSVPGARWTVVQEAGHLVPAEQPSATADELRTFLEGATA